MRTALRAMLVLVFVGGCIPWNEAYDAWDGGAGGGGGGTPDSGAPDAGALDAGTTDSGTPDAGEADGGVDAGVDAGPQLPPTVSSISPTAATADGGVHVFINGANFIASDVPHVGGVPCTSFTFDNPNVIECDVPPVSGALEIAEVGYGVIRDADGGARVYSSNGGFTFLGHPSLWLDSTDPSTMVLRSDGGPYIARWVDKSEHHNDVSQPTDHLQPQVITSSTGVKVLLFHSSPNNCGVAPYACGPQSYLERLDPDLPNDAGARTLFITATVLAADAGDSPPSSNPVLFWGDGNWCSGNRVMSFGFSGLGGGTEARFGAGFGGRDIGNDGGDVSAGAWTVLQYSYAGGAVGPGGLSRDGLPVATTFSEQQPFVGLAAQTGGVSPASAASCGFLTSYVFPPFVLEIGRVGLTPYGNDSFNGALAGALVYPRVLTPSESAVVNRWLRANAALP